MTRPRPLRTNPVFIARFIGLGGIVLGFALCGAVFGEDSAEPDTPLVERLEIHRNQFLTPETFLYYISTKAGDRYDEFRLREDFRRLWDTGFVDDLSIDVIDGPKGGKVVRFLVVERKRVAIVDYRGGKSVTSTTIDEELKEKEAAIKIDSFYDPGKARRVAQIIKEMLSEKGRPFAKVEHETKGVGGAGVQLSFTIEEGPKARVVDVDFVGNEKFSDGKLRRQMKVKARGFWNMTWLLGKTTYTPEKWSDPQEGDKKKLEDFYLNHGYVTAVVGEPRLSYVDVKKGKKPVKGIRMEIPVSEGDQYRVGEIKFDGMKLFNAELVRPLFKIKTGDVYREKTFRKGFDKLRDAYGAQGYFQWTARTDRKSDPERKTVDVTLAMDEDQRYYVGKITFTGNSSTRDKVIRREVYMNEGDVFNTEALKLSIRRINQLGYFQPMEGVPDLGPSQLGDDKIDVTFKVEEQNRNQFSFGGGVSGLEGTFINASFQTANFLGKGETFSISAQAGGRTNNYQIAVTEPYLFDRPITAGFDVYSRKIDYLTSEGTVGYSEVRVGASLTAGLPLQRFTRLFTNYTYEVVDTAVRDDLLSGTGQGDSSTPLFNVFATEGRNQESRFTPSLVHNTVDNPWTPRSGRRLTAALPVAGGPLGGTVDYWKPSLEAIVYIPHTRRTALGVRGEVGWVRRFGDTRQLPYYQRYFLGGETQIRGVDARTVSPLDANNSAVGGNKFILFNAEYYFDIGGPLRFLLFFDAGEAYAEGKSFNLRTLRTSTGAELRFLMPVLNVPFRLIYAYNANRDVFQPRTAFKFAVGTTF